jgi:cytochrome c oxidase assembly protein subunit 15
LWILSVLHLIDAARTFREGSARTHALFLTSLVTLQAVLGILTLLHQVPIGLALAHQAGAILVLTVATMHAQQMMRRRAEQPLPVAAKAS